MRRMKEHHKLLMPSLIVSAGIVAFPTVFLLYVSLHRWVLFEAETKFTWLGNFFSVIISNEFLGSIGITAIFVISTMKSLL